MAIVSDNSDENLKMAANIRTMVEKDGPSELLLNFTIKPSGDSLAILNIIRDSKFRAVVLISQPVITSTFLKKAMLHGLINLNSTWILGVIQAAQFEGHENVSVELPNEIIEMKLIGQRDRFASFDYFMQDSISIFQNALKYMEKYNVNSRSPINFVCPDDDVDNFSKNLSK